MYRLILALTLTFLAASSFCEDVNLSPAEHKYKVLPPYNILIMEPHSVVESHEGGLKYHANSFGFRDDEFETISDKKLMLVSGESRAYGIGVDYRERWTNLLNPRLPQVDVYNLSMPAASLEHQYLILDHMLSLLKRSVDYIFVQVPPQQKELPLLREHIWGAPKPQLVRENNRWRFLAAPLEFSQTWAQNLGLSIYGESFYVRGLAHWVGWLEDNYRHVRLSFMRSYQRRELYLRWSALLEKFNELALIYGSKLVFITSDWNAQKMVKEHGFDFVDIKAMSTSRYHVNPLVKHVNLEGNDLIARKVACQIFDQCDDYQKK